MKQHISKLENFIHEQQVKQPKSIQIAMVFLLFFIALALLGLVMMRNIDIIPNPKTQKVMPLEPSLLYNYDQVDKKLSTSMRQQALEIEKRLEEMKNNPETSADYYQLIKDRPGLLDSIEYYKSIN